MIKFQEETNIFVRYNEEFVKSGVLWTEVLWVFIDKNEGTKRFCSIQRGNSLKIMFIKIRVHRYMFKMLS